MDNAATSFLKPQEVLSAVLDTLSAKCFSANRSGHRGSLTLSNQVFDCRTKVARLVNAQDEECVSFTLNCTHALNVCLQGSAKKNGHVIISAYEHNSVLRPLYEMKARGIIDVTVLQPDQHGHITPRSVAEAIRRNTCLVALSHVSNVTGATQDITAIGALLAKFRICFLVDAAQSVGYLPIDMRRASISLLCFPAHKGLHGIQGCGVMCIDKRYAPRPIVYGGTGSESNNLQQPKSLPECYESGTLNAPSIIALSHAIDWYNMTFRERLPRIEKLQNDLLTMLSELPYVKVYSPRNRSGIVSFSIDGFDSNQVAEVLDKEYDIACRSGLHCAPLAHKWLGTHNEGLVRVSLSAENTLEHLFTLLRAIEKIYNTREARVRSN